MPLFHIHGLIGALLSSLVAGGSVVCTPGFAVDHFGDWLATFHPTWYSAVPTMHQAVLESARQQGAGSAPGALRFIRSGSAALAQTVATGLERVFGAPVIENYGMTEAAHQMASNPLPPRPHKLGSVGVPAGPEIAIMDDAGGLLAPGSLGEIVIRGDNVMGGYENNPAANATAFTNGWFRTGDQGYFDPDGYLYLTSRIKEIINRGGEKIAPVEIDDVLLTHPAVAQAVTFAVPHPTLGEDVAAAVVLRPGATATVRELRGFVGAHLAAFKVPSRILVLDELPKGPTGKLQRIGLAERLGLTVHHETTEATAATEARSPLEEGLARVWAEVLRLDHVGIHDNFLELGGDSIEATLIASRAHDELSLDIPLDVLLGESTIAEQARAIESHDQTALPPIRHRTDAAGTAPLSYGQERLWLAAQEGPDGSLLGIRPEYLRLRGPLDATVLERVLNEIVHRHEVLRTTYATVDGSPVQVIAPGLVVSLPLLDLSSRPAADQQAELRRLTAEDFRQPFDLARGPLLRARLLRFGATDHVLLLTFHHIAFDGWSAGVLVRELAALYGAFAAGKRSPLPALPVQYADYAVWQRDLMASHALDAQEAYWKETLGDGLPPSAVPTERAGPPGPDARDADRTWVLPRDLTDALKALSRREGVTLFMTLLGAFNVLLQRLTGQESIVVRSPIAGRTHAELEGLIGFFMNMLALRTDLAGNPSFRELLARVRRETLGAYTHQDVPFLALIRDLAPRVDLSREGQLSDPAFQLRNVGQRTARAADLEISQLDVEIDAPKMDLYLELEETADGLSCLWVYRTDLFERAAVEAMMARFRALLTAVVADPGSRLTALPF